MATENIVNQFGTKGSVLFFPGEYNPSTTSKYKISFSVTQNISDTIDYIDSYQDIVILGSSTTQTVYVFRLNGTALNLIKKITPATSNLSGCSMFGSIVKINQYGIFISDPQYLNKGAVFCYWVRTIGAYSWYDNPVTIVPFNYSKENDGLTFGYSFDVGDSIIMISSIKDNLNAGGIGDVYFFTYNYNTKYIGQTYIILNPDSSSTTFGKNIIVYNNQYGYVSSSDAPDTLGITYSNSGKVYTLDTNSDSITGNVPNISPGNNINFGSSISMYNLYSIISSPNQTEGVISLYKGNSNKWENIQNFNMTTLGIDTYSSGLEGTSIFIYNTLILWNNVGSGNVYIAEITDADTVVPSHTSKITKAGYDYGILYTGVYESLIIGGSNGDGTTSFDIYSINLV